MAETEWTEIPPGELRAAQERLGYSDAQMAHLLHVKTEKTWWRWRTEGRVPTNSIPAVAIVLQRPQWLEHFNRPVDGESEELRELRKAVEDLRVELEEVRDQRRKT